MDVTAKYWRYALWLSVFTIFYNLVEGLVSLYFGVHDETLTLFGFGIDSFIEVVSGIGIFTMVLRIRHYPDSHRSQFERAALRITGISFYLLSIGLAGTAIYNMFSGHKPTTTLSGIIISFISIVIMWILVLLKRKVGKALNSIPICADANCTMVCIYMSFVLLAACLIYQITGFGFADIIGATGLIYFSVKEGKEAFEKASSMKDCCND
jgi:divalent metal cation (Fe/Co/Zn/Cd) transporter